MDRAWEKLVAPGVLAVCCLLAVYIAVFRPGYLSSITYLGGLLFLQLLVLAAWRFRQRFFPLVLLAFLAAGTSVPFHGAWTSARWVVLAVGALVGAVLYLREPRHRFRAFHFLAFACVLSALVSALVSAFPEVALLKALSLLLLFLYAGSGARLAFAGREERFFHALLLACEALVYLTTAAYFVFRFPVFGNPNSLGAVMGVVVAPLLLWSVLANEAKHLRRRHILALTLCFLLLFYSQARAGMVAALVSSSLLCFVLRRFRFLLHGAALVVALAFAAMLVTPVEPDRNYMPSRQPGSTFTTHFLYKDKRETGVMGSRLSPWDEATTVIQQRPWFGTGFGTTVNGDADDDSIATAKYSSTPKVVREHGNSYLTITEGVGLLGLTPFALLVLLTLINLGRVFFWMGQTRSVHHFAVPVAMVVAAGLVHATFEDWLFAVGYYLCVFFWVFAFALVDLLPSSAAIVTQVAPQPRFVQVPPAFPPGTPPHAPPVY